MIKGQHKKLATVLGENIEIINQAKGYAPEFFHKASVVIAPVTIHIQSTSCVSVAVSASASSTVAVSVKKENKYEHSEAQIIKDNQVVQERPWWKCPCW